MSPSSCEPNLAAITFFAKSHLGDVCGSNGLPLTPNSIAILGRSQILKTYKHPNLCQYLDVIRGKHERTIIVSEFFGTPLDQLTKLNDHQQFQLITIDIILKMIYQIADALHFIHTNGFVNHNLEPSNILIDTLNNVKLFNYGMFYMTKEGDYVSFPIGNIRYMSPEKLLGSKDNIKSDVWSLGIIILELIFQCTLWPSYNISQIMRKILSLCNTKNVVEKITREMNCLEKYETMNGELKDLLENCLTISPRDRFTPDQILNHSIFQRNPDAFTYKEPPLPKSQLLQLPLQQIYYLWQLAGGDVYSELKKEGLIRSEAPILLMPQVILLNGQTITAIRSQSHMFDDRIVLLSLSNLTERLFNVKQSAYFPLIHTPLFAEKYCVEMEELPLVIREKHTEYQFHRVILFTRLLQGYPHTRKLIIKESEIDIPPFLRGEIWSCLLGVHEQINTYDKIDKIKSNSTDRQIEVDIPRCHQYDELLSSPEGHKKLKRLLKAWVTFHPQYVYWQGLDSLTAPFLYLNFNNEARAFLSLYKFIPKYLHCFFLQDNSAVIKEYLCKFSQLTAFHEPILSKHLNAINFIPELFAIPWFLTMFSHVLPLHKIIHLWDKLLLGDNSYPLFIGISILKQLKITLLASGFNECILLFSDLPDIVMETCVIESQKMYLLTPKSVTYRKYVIEETSPTEFDISDIDLTDLQQEVCPRISGRDLKRLVLKKYEHKIIIDLRNSNEFQRMHIIDSINIPFSSVQLGDTRLESLNVNDFENLVFNKIVIIVSVIHENAMLFSKFLIDHGIAKVCILHKGFNITHSIVPSILTSSA